jgi:hypothetical protein
MDGDALASGRARTATFGGASSVSQDKWDEIWGKPKKRRAAGDTRLVRQILADLMGVELTKGEGERIVAFVRSRIRRP